MGGAPSSSETSNLSDRIWLATRHMRARSKAKYKLTSLEPLITVIFNYEGYQRALHEAMTDRNYTCDGILGRKYVCGWIYICDPKQQELFRVVER